MRHINCSSVLVAAILVATSCASDSRTVDNSAQAADTNPGETTTATAAAPSSTAAAPISAAPPTSTVAPTTAESQPPPKSAQLPQGAEPFELDPTAFHHEHRQSVLANATRDSLDLSRDGHRRHRVARGGRRHYPDQDDGQWNHRTGRARHVDPWRRDHRGHHRLVRAGLGRQRVVRRRGHRRVRGWRRRLHGRIVASGRRWSTPWRDRSGRSPTRPRVPPGVLRRPGRGQRRGCQPRRDR